MKGLSKTRLYPIFSGMKQRCYNPHNQHYKWYGEKGFAVLDIGNPERKYIAVDFTALWEEAE